MPARAVLRTAVKLLCRCAAAGCYPARMRPLPVTPRLATQLDARRHRILSCSRQACLGPPFVDFRIASSYRCLSPPVSAGCCGRGQRLSTERKTLTTVPHTGGTSRELQVACRLQHWPGHSCNPPSSPTTRRPPFPRPSPSSAPTLCPRLPSSLRGNTTSTCTPHAHHCRQGSRVAPRSNALLGSPPWRSAVIK